MTLRCLILRPKGHGEKWIANRDYLKTRPGAVYVAERKCYLIDAPLREIDRARAAYFGIVHLGRDPSEIKRGPLVDQIDRTTKFRQEA